MPGSPVTIACSSGIPCPARRAVEERPLVHDQRHVRFSGDTPPPGARCIPERDPAEVGAPQILAPPCDRSAYRGSAPVRQAPPPLPVGKRDDVQRNVHRVPRLGVEQLGTPACSGVGTACPARPNAMRAWVKGRAGTPPPGSVSRYAPCHHSVIASSRRGESGLCPVRRSRRKSPSPCSHASNSGAGRSPSTRRRYSASWNDVLW